MKTKNFSNVTFVPRGLQASAGEQRLEISYWSPQVMRVTWSRAGAEPSCRMSWLLPERRLPGELAHSEDQTTARLWLPSGDHARVRLQKEQGLVELLSAHGEVLAALQAGPGEKGRFRCTFSLAAQEELFGLGLQLHALKQRGRRRLLKINADPKDDSGSAHVVVPLLLSTHGYGVLVNTHEYTWWDLGRERDDRWWVEVPGEAFEVFLLSGSLREQVREYLALTGGPALPPKWGLGFWYRPKSGWDEAEVKRVLEEFQRRDLPCQVVGLEPSWQTHSYPCSYVWNRDQWPDPAKFAHWLDEHGMKLNLWEHAYVHESSPLYGPLQKAGLAGDAQVFGGLVPDFLLARARELYTTLHEREHVSLGVAGYKLDECDGSDYTGGWFFPDDSHFPSGLTGAQMHNIFGFLYQRTMHELFENKGRRTYFLCRANYAGGQAFATCNYSDWYGFGEYVRLLANAGFAATPWCPEVRHLDDAADFVRRSQVVFTSWLAMINAWSSGIRPWDQGDQAEAIFRTYAHLRQDLLPYLYAEWEAQARTGLALTRALAVDFQQDPASLGVDDQYLFGRWLMVAPVVHGERRQVYFPPGQWRDWWTGEVYEGPARIQYSAPLERLPLFLREGAIVPMLGQNQQPFGPWRHLKLLLWPSEAPTDYELYDDDGETTQYLQGAYWRWPVRVQCIPEGITFGLGDPQGALTPWLRRLTLEVLGVTRPGGVMANAHPMPQLDEAAVRAGKTGWAPGEGRVLVSVPAQPGMIVAILEDRPRQ